MAHATKVSATDETGQHITAHIAGEIQKSMVKKWNSSPAASLRSSPRWGTAIWPPHLRFHRPVGHRRLCHCISDPLNQFWPALRLTCTDQRGYRQRDALLWQIFGQILPPVMRRRL
jgi:hypothetical protein